MRSCNHCCSGKAVSISYCECVFVALVMQYAMRMRHNFICPIRLYNTVSHDFRKSFLYVKCLFWYCLQFFSLTFLILRRTKWDMIINVYWSKLKVSVILVRFSLKLNFRDGFSKNTLILNFMKIRWVGLELFHADIRTDGRMWRS